MGMGSDRWSPLRKTFFLGGILKKANGRNFSLVLSNEDANESKHLESFLRRRHHAADRILRQPSDSGLSSFA